MMPTLKLWRRWRCRSLSQRGAVAIEFALVLPAVLLIVWAFWQMSEAYRLQWDLNRQTAAIADMLVNQPEEFATQGTGESYTVSLDHQLPTLTTTANNLLKEALGKDNPDIHTGITVEYAPGTSTADGEVLSYNFSAGRRCPTITGTVPLLSLTGDAGGQLTPPATSTQSGIRLLRVQSCVMHKDRPSFLNLLAPKDYASKALAVRKES